MSVDALDVDRLSIATTPATDDSTFSRKIWMLTRASVSADPLDEQDPGGTGKYDADIVSLCIERLSSEHDIRAAVELCRAMVRSCRDLPDAIHKSMRLLKRFYETGGPPQPDDEEGHEPLIGTFDDQVSAALQELPLGATFRGVSWSLFAIDKLEGLIAGVHGRKPQANYTPDPVALAAERDEFNENLTQSVNATSLPDLQLLAQRLHQVLDAVNEFVTMKAAVDSFGEGGLHKTRATLTRCIHHLEAEIRGRTGQAAPETEVEPGGEVQPSLQTQFDRKVAARQIEVLATAWAEAEPHSPIPFLLMRAVRLARMDFSKMMSSILQDDHSFQRVKSFLEF